jgi:hypothetical protein
VFGYRQRVVRGVTIDTVTVADEPATWEAAGFSVDGDGTCRIGHVRVALVGREHGKRILGWTLRGVPTGPDHGDSGLDDSGLDGLATAITDAEPCEPAVHPNGAELIDHIVLLTPDRARTLAAFGSVGLEPRRTRETDQYGAPFVQTFFVAGEVIVELIGPAEPSGDGATGFFGLAHTVHDLDATKALLGDHLGAVKDAVQPGRRIATLRHKDVGMSVATAFMSPEQP